MIYKRRLGSAVKARTYWSQCRALMLKAVSHNILILYALSGAMRLAARLVFYRARMSPFSVGCDGLGILHDQSIDKERRLSMIDGFIP